MAVEFMPGEKVLFIRRRHWFRLLLSLIMPVFFILIIPIGYGATEWYGGAWLVNHHGELLLFAGLLIQAFIMGLFLMLLNYYLDLWILTDKRMIAIQIHGLFSRDISSVDYGRIQEITVTVNGLVETLLDYGDIEIQTAGSFRAFLFRDIAQPADVKEKVLQLKEQFLKTGDIHERHANGGT
jgi:uncharacterized membrane protein YdbT with pleckstrin-like domain